MLTQLTKFQNWTEETKLQLRFLIDEEVTLIIFPLNKENQCNNTA